MDKRLLDILCCPSTHVPVRLASSRQLEAINAGIRAGTLLTAAGARLDRPLEAALVTQDLKLAYPIQDGIPVMLVDEAISLLQLEAFPER